MLVGFFIQDEVMDFARSAPHGAYWHTNVVDLTGSIEWSVGLTNRVRPAPTTISGPNKQHNQVWPPMGLTIAFIGRLDGG